MPNLGLNPSLITQKLYTNLNVQNVSGNSKMRTLSEGFAVESETIYSAVNAIHDNMYVSTADETTLEAIGYQEGLYRVKEPKVRLMASDKVAYVTIPELSFINSTKNISGALLSKGDTLLVNSQGLQLIILEDVLVNNLTANTRVFISVDIKSSGTNGYSISGSSEVAVSNIPTVTRTVTSSILFGLTMDIAIPAILEDLDNFRVRVSYAKNASKYGTDSAIRIAIASNPLVKSYTINYDVYPYTVFLYNPSLLLNNAYRDYISSYVVPAVDTQILLRKSAGSSFIVDLPRAVEFYLTLVDKNGALISFDQTDLRDYIASIYVFGTEFTVNKELLIAFFLNTGISFTQLDSATLQVRKYKEGFSYLSSENSISVNAQEYPFVVTGIPISGL